MEDLDKTIAPRKAPAFEPEADLTMPGKRDRKPDGRFAVGDMIMNRYKVLSELGQGGMGVVYKCFDETAGIEVALKALPPELSHNTLEMDDIKDNFQLVHNLHHPNIASSNNLERDNSNGNYYLIMECCEGEDLRRWIRLKRQEAGILTPEEILPIIRQIASALDYAHEEKILHRDIKPGNVMVDFRGKVKVLDFGLAAQIHSSMSRVSQTVHGTSGTPSYMAPEQWRGRVQDAAADQYALAVIAYEMLAGHLPFDNPDSAVLKQAVLDETPEKIANVPQYIQSAIFKALSKTPDERFSSCTAFADALENKTVPEQKHEVQLKPEPTPARTAPSAEYYDLKLSAEDCEKKFNERNFQTTAEMNKLSRLIKIAEQRSDFPFAVSKLKELIAETEKVFAENAKREEEQKQLSEAIQNVEKIKENFRKKDFKFSPKMLELKRLADEAESRQDFESAISLLDDLLKESETVSALEEKRLANLRKEQEEKERLLKMEEKENNAKKRKNILSAICCVVVFVGSAVVHLVGEQVRKEQQIRDERARKEQQIRDMNRQAWNSVKNAENANFYLPGGVELKMVRLPDGIYMGKYEVTQGQWNALMDKNFRWHYENRSCKSENIVGEGKDYPMYFVSWHDAKAFCEKLNSQGYAPKGWKFTLPTEEQWEYACRARTTTEYSYGDDSDSSRMNCNSKGTVKVGSLNSENKFGLSDMYGNVWEWRLDASVRGGGWNDDAQDCRLAGRCDNVPTYRNCDVGFRVALVPVN